ncbi:hypothetical protein B0T22DRAFT_301916 [Podospora appendiculata]|uniref:Uncharacterized protein n=1 Tax=Podospora appendiculata TaxID=314037 RepID=A0AAE0X0F1_9PEZI|nr:hypothetical protein B0T22DRAFT_301916 [Podospora appendiculata]
MGLQLHPSLDSLFTGEHQHHVTPLEARGVGWDDADYHHHHHHHHHLADILLSSIHQLEPPRRSSSTQIPIHKKPFFAQWTTDLDEAATFARSALRLPNHSDSERSHRRRTPSLDRQDAFCDAATAKKRRYGTDADAELYRLGLLYDDPHERGAGFTFDALPVECERPVYQLRVRPAKRGRGRRRRVVRGDGDGDVDVESSLELRLRLSCTPLGEDGEIARLMAPDVAEEGDETVFVPVGMFERMESDEEEKEGENNEMGEGEKKVEEEGERETNGDREDKVEVDGDTGNQGAWAWTLLGRNGDDLGKDAASTVGSWTVEDGDDGNNTATPHADLDINTWIVLGTCSDGS